MTAIFLYSFWTAQCSARKYTLSDCIECQPIAFTAFQHCTKVKTMINTQWRTKGNEKQKAAAATALLKMEYKVVNRENGLVS